MRASWRPPLETRRSVDNRLSSTSFSVGGLDGPSSALLVILICGSGATTAASKTLSWPSLRQATPFLSSPTVTRACASTIASSPMRLDMITRRCSGYSADDSTQKIALSDSHLRFIEVTFVEALRPYYPNLSTGVNVLYKGSVIISEGSTHD